MLIKIYILKASLEQKYAPRCTRTTLFSSSTSSNPSQLSSFFVQAAKPGDILNFLNNGAICFSRRNLYLSLGINYTSSTPVWKVCCISGIYPAQTRSSTRRRRAEKSLCIGAKMLDLPRSRHKKHIIDFDILRSANILSTLASTHKYFQ